MKFISVIVVIAGIVVFILAVISALFHVAIPPATAGGYIRGSSSLFLLALVIMIFDRFYCRKQK